MSTDRTSVRQRSQEITQQLEHKVEGVKESTFRKPSTNTETQTDSDASTKPAGTGRKVTMSGASSTGSTGGSSSTSASSARQTSTTTTGDRYRTHQIENVNNAAAGDVIHVIEI